MLNTPVALIAFRRPQFTERVLQAIGRVQPRTMLVFADGPRPGNAGDIEACRATRALVDGLDWDCEVLKQYSDVNLGCGRGPATAIDWIFSQVPEAIILEDDCLPDPSFFHFCEEMLERYRNDERVMHIGGSTYQRGTLPVPYSYFFSCFNGAWGWATWRRAWKFFDLSVKRWPLLRDTTWLTDILEDKKAVGIWAKEFAEAYNRGGEVGYWDHQWTFACWANSGLSVRPNRNLVSNIGCCENATNTLSAADPRANLPAGEMTFPLIHPPMVLQNRELDRRFLKEVVFAFAGGAESRRRRLLQVISRWAPASAKEAYRGLISSFRPT
ncbi:MAG: hypothetical protein QOH39_2158 [Verrucomicrobiota bacterium]